jgi:hypothetical protein
MNLKKRSEMTKTEERNYRERLQKDWGGVMGDFCVAVTFVDGKWVEKPKVQNGDRWGMWEYDEKSQCLFYRDVGEYWIEIDMINTPAKLGRWCLHMQEKSWVTVEDLGNLIRAAADITGMER